MDDNQDSNAAESVQTGENQSAADSSQSGYVTADQLAEFGRDMMGNFRKTMAGMLKTQPQTEQPKKEAEPAQQPAQTVDVAALLRNERVTSSAIAKHGLSDEQGEVVRQLIEAQSPEDPAAFISNFAKTMKIAVPGASANPNPNQMATPPNPNPVSDGGTPGMTPTLESDDIPMWRWSQEKVDRFVAEKGLREFAKLAKQRLNKDMHGVRFSLPKG